MSMHRTNNFLNFSAFAGVLFFLIYCLMAAPASCSRGGKFISSTSPRVGSSSPTPSDRAQPRVAVDREPEQPSDCSTTHHETIHSQQSGLHEDPLPTRIMLEPSTSPAPAPTGEQRLTVSSNRFSTSTHNLFSMLPRAHRVPPSGPSRGHNSVLTDISN
ncbi:hypothetical protein KP509_27G033800 [Ceratopteris richardii]|uniref:Transmembrane protein n=1 Tax=Ceratopteris richardii TaxID=49495 RepID=A0A8T2RH44_CERRI|nr:hypothetical protein KP509_27G033800 [Ceratopteris richardii]